MSIGENVGFHIHAVADHALDRIAPAVHGRRDRFDDDPAAPFVGKRLAHAPWLLSQTALSGGRVTRTDHSRPCRGSRCASTPPMLPTPDPPYSAASLFSSSRQ